MTPEERQLLSGLFDRLNQANPGEVDREAMDFIQNAIRANPKAAYVMAQSVLVQEEMINTATARVSELEKEVGMLKQAASAAPAAAAASRSAIGGIPRRIGGGMGAGMGGGMGAGATMAAAPAAPPSGINLPRPGAGVAPGMAPGMGAAGMGAAPGGPAPGPWQRQQPEAQSGGGGFLKTALGAAVGVAGGMLLANSLSSMFGGNKAQAAEGAQSPAGSNDGWGDTGGGGWQADNNAATPGGGNWGDDGGGAWNSDDSGSWDDSAGSGDSWGGDE